ncbi:MAG: ribonuclease III [Oscillospiraceae bacterium]|nr:ribonuclease III [Oscillospiraceae bacterium]
MPKSTLSELEKKTGRKFENIEYLRTAVTHSSYANECGRETPYNERQEFLGDSVLSVIVSDYLYRSTHLSEGDLTKLRAILVCEKSLCAFARSISLGSYMLLGRGEENTGGTDRPSILADAFEAVIAAVYLDGGIEAARSFVIPFIETALETERKKSLDDYKTLLQEIVQKNPQETLQYVLVDESGPAHDRRFEVEVLLNSNVVGHGVGKSKKAAEQLAAKEALKLMGQ